MPYTGRRAATFRRRSRRFVPSRDGQKPPLLLQRGRGSQPLINEQSGDHQDHDSR
jgi:hypothetical protein